MDDMLVSEKEFVALLICIEKKCVSSCWVY